MKHVGWNVNTVTSLSSSAYYITRMHALCTWMGSASQTYYWSPPLICLFEWRKTAGKAVSPASKFTQELKLLRANGIARHYIPRIGAIISCWPLQLLWIYSGLLWLIPHWRERRNSWIKYNPFHIQTWWADWRSNRNNISSWCFMPICYSILNLLHYQLLATAFFFCFAAILPSCFFALLPSLLASSRTEPLSSKPVSAVPITGYTIIHCVI